MSQSCRKTRMRSIVCALLIASGLAVMASGAEIPGKDKKNLRIIFVGNSFTMYSNLSNIIKVMLESQGYAVAVSEFLQAGQTLKNHWERNESKHQFDQILENGTWDYVVLQGQSEEALTPNALGSFQKYVQMFAEKIRDKNKDTKVLLFMTWANKARPEDQAKITEGYNKVGKELNLSVVPVGAAWKAVFAEKPDMVLHINDNRHPAFAGSYLAACVFYAQITGKSPLGLINIIPSTNRKIKTQQVSADEAKFLQEKAWEAIQNTTK